MTIKEGDYVGYLSVLTDTEFQHVGKVLDTLPEGIPSCAKPMVKIQGKAGYVLETHCKKLPEAARS